MSSSRPSTWPRVCASGSTSPRVGRRWTARPSPRWSSTRTGDRRVGETNDLYQREQKRIRSVVARLEDRGRESMVNRNQRGGTMTYRELRFLQDLGYIDSLPEPNE